MVDLASGELEGSAGRVRGVVVGALEHEHAPGVVRLDGESGSDELALRSPNPHLAPPADAGDLLVHLQRLVGDRVLVPKSHVGALARPHDSPHSVVEGPGVHAAVADEVVGGELQSVVHGPPAVAVMERVVAVEAVAHPFQGPAADGTGCDRLLAERDGGYVLRALLGRGDVEDPGDIVGGDHA